MNQRELARIAKEWFVDYGKSGKQNFAELQHTHDLDDDQMMIVIDHFNRCVRRVKQELFR